MKRLACTVGVHAWTRRVERGESYKVCSACGHTPRAGPHSAAAHAEGFRGGFGLKLVGLAVLVLVVVGMCVFLIYAQRAWERSRGSQSVVSQPSRLASAAVVPPSRRLGWTDSEMCRQLRLISLPSSCWHRRRCLRGCVR